MVKVCFNLVSSSMYVIREQIWKSVLGGVS